MGFFDRFTSSKGKDTKATPQRGVVKSAKPSKEDEEKKAFTAVPSGKEAKAEKKVEAKGEQAKAPVSKESTHQAYATLIRPVITEKSTRLAKLNQYVFLVAPSATKEEVRQAIFHTYDIHPLDVTMVNLPGKTVRYGRTSGRQPGRRKAIISLPAGKTIDVTNG